MGNPTGIHLVFGDSFLVEEALGRLLGSLRAGSGGDLAIETVDAKEQGTDGVIAEIMSPSLFSLNKVTVVKDFDLSSRSKLTKELEKCVAAGLAPGQSLVLVPNKVDKRLRIIKAIAKQGGLMELPGLSHDGLRKWIVERFQAEGKTISPAIAEALIELKGEDDLRAIDSEIEKIVTYAGTRKSIEQGDVEALVGRSKTEKVWQLIGLVAAKEVADGLETLGDLLEANESPIGIVYLLSREVRWLIQVRLFLADEHLKWDPSMQFQQFRRLLLPKIKAWVEANDIPAEATFIRQNPYAAYRRFQESAEFSLSGLTHLLAQLLDANVQLVSTSVKPRVVLERVVASLSM
jgi:DNA polymerase-3 subunit delta